jgi:hypothetical protein
MYKHLSRAEVLIAFLALLACAPYRATRNDAAHSAMDKGDPTASLPVARLTDGVTPNPTDTKGAPPTAGRPLLETLRGSAHVDIAAFAVAPRDIAPAAPATGLDVQIVTGTASGKTRYSFDLHIKELRYRDATYTYFDWAKAIRH